MRENMSNGLGEVDRGPRRDTTLDRYPRISGVPEAYPGQPEDEVAAVIKQGRTEPRRLSLVESRTADRNRALARGNYAALEDWYDDSQREKDPHSREQRYPGGASPFKHAPSKTEW